MEGGTPPQRRTTNDTLRYIAKDVLAEAVLAELWWDLSGNREEEFHSKNSSYARNGNRLINVSLNASFDSFHRN